MKPPNDQQTAARVAELLGEYLGNQSATSPLEPVGPQSFRHDYVVVVGPSRFVTEYKSQANTASVMAAIDSFGSRAAAEQRGTMQSGDIPLIVVPFMGPAGQALCAQHQISWLDLCGNARILAPGLRIWIEGRPNQFKERGRPSNLFAPKSSRLARHLLTDPDRFQSQADLARQTGLGDGYVSKLVRRLLEEDLLVSNQQGAVRPRDPNLLLDAWHEAYRFNHHRTLRGHVPVRTGVEMLRHVQQRLSASALEWGVTGLGAAWLYCHFATFRTTAVYLSELPTQKLLDDLGFTEEPRGSNLWLVLPDDPHVLRGMRIEEGIRCVSPLQAYLDLKDQGERAPEAAQELRNTYLNWKRHA